MGKILTSYRQVEEAVATLKWLCRLGAVDSDVIEDYRVMLKISYRGPRMRFRDLVRRAVENGEIPPEVARAILAGEEDEGKEER